MAVRDGSLGLRDCSAFLGMCVSPRTSGAGSASEHDAYGDLDNFPLCRLSTSWQWTLGAGAEAS